MFSRDQYNQMLYSLPSFYKDFLPIDNNLLKLIEVYAKSIDYVWELFREAEDADHISTTRTLSTIPYFKLSIDDGMYDLTTASMLSRLTFEQQIQYLEKQQKFVTLTFDKRDNAGIPVVYSMRLFVNFADKEPLRLYEDYFIRSNRIYLLPNYVQKRKQSVHYLHAFDIKYNDNTLEKNFGTRFSVQAGPLLPRYEYRDVLEAFMRVFQGDMTIKSIREGIQLATKWESFKLEDYKSPNLSPTKRKLYEEWIISPMKFILSLPEDLIPDKVKVNIVRTLLNEVKEVPTDFMVFFEINRLDPYAVPMSRFPTIHYNRGDELKPEDDLFIPKVTLKFKDFPLDIHGRYDSTFSYNFNLQYDDPPSNEIIGLTIDQHAVDTMSGTSKASVTYYPLMIPRNFTATKDASGNITFKVNSSVGTTTHFELYGAATQQGPYTLIETIANNTNVQTISFSHNAKGSGKLYYRSRSKDPREYSLYTLPVNINAL